MSGPLIPFIEAPEIPLSFLQYLPFLDIDPADPPTIKPFGTLVAIGVYVGSWVTMQRAKDRRLDTKLMSDFIFWVVASGFVISHVFDALTYHPDTVARDPLYLLKIWDGLSSWGGLMGAMIGAFAWRQRRGHNILEYCDVTVSAFPLAWVFGRAGCAVVHDHPGRLSDAWFAVQFPDAPPGMGRFDLGLIEMVLTIPLAVAFWWLWRQKPFRPNGFYIAVALLAYSPVRFVLDFLRVEPDAAIFRGATDNRYAGLTPAQWACFGGFALGAYFLWRIKGRDYEPNGTKEREPEPAEDEDLDDDDRDEEAPRRRKRKPARARAAASGTPATTEARPKKRKRAKAKKAAARTKPASETPSEA